MADIDNIGSQKVIEKNGGKVFLKNIEREGTMEKFYHHPSI
jgi:predicted acetyltransferase